MIIVIDVVAKRFLSFVPILVFSTSTNTAGAKYTRESLGESSIMLFRLSARGR